MKKSNRKLDLVRENIRTLGKTELGGVGGGETGDDTLTLATRAKQNLLPTAKV